jgi:hypothetical protein
MIQLRRRSKIGPKSVTYYLNGPLQIFALGHALAVDDVPAVVGALLVFVLVVVDESAQVWVYLVSIRVSDSTVVADSSGLGAVSLKIDSVLCS